MQEKGTHRSRGKEAGSTGKASSIPSEELIEELCIEYHGGCASDKEPLCNGGSGKVKSLRQVTDGRAVPLVTQRLFRQMFMDTLKRCIWSLTRWQARKWGEDVAVLRGARKRLFGGEKLHRLAPGYYALRRLEWVASTSPWIPFFWITSVTAGINVEADFALPTAQVRAQSVCSLCAFGPSA